MRGGVVVIELLGAEEREMSNDITSYLSLDARALHIAIKLNPRLILGFHKELCVAPKKYLDKIYTEFCKYAKSTLSLSTSKLMTRLTSKSFVSELLGQYAKSLRGEYGVEVEGEVHAIISTWLMQSISLSYFTIGDAQRILKSLFGYTMKEEEVNNVLSTLVQVSQGGESLSNLLTSFCEDPYKKFFGEDKEEGLQNLLARSPASTQIEVLSLVSFTSKSEEMARVRFMWIKCCLEDKYKSFASYKKFTNYYKGMWGVPLTDAESSYGLSVYTQLKNTPVVDEIISPEVESEEGGVISPEVESEEGGVISPEVESLETEIISLEVESQSQEGVIISEEGVEVDFGVLRIKMSRGSSLELGEIRSQTMNVLGGLKVSVGGVEEGVLRMVKIG